MSKKEYQNDKDAEDVERTSDEILEDIAKDGENISQTVEQLGECIKDKLDWRERVKNSPYITTGVAVGIGYIASGMLMPHRSSNERIIHSIGREVHEVLGGMRAQAAGAGLIRVTILGIAAKVAAGLIKGAASKGASAVAQKDDSQNAV